MTTADLFRWAETFAAIGAAWLLTYALHSSVLIGSTWVLQRMGVIRSLRLRDLAWRGALIGGLVTATVQMGMGLAPWGLTLEVPRPETPKVATLLRSVQPTAPALVLLDTTSTLVADTGDAETDGDVVLAEAPDVQAPAAAPVATESAPMAAVAVPSVRVGALFFMAWVAASSVLLLRLAVARARVLDGLGLRAPVLEPKVLAQLDLLCQEAGRQDAVRLTTAEGLKSPVALGWSEICLPKAALSELDEAQQRSVLAHELAHIERKDPLWLLLGTTLEQLLFFQPLNRLARRNMQEVAEYLCDDWAAACDGSGLPIARGLASVARWLDGEERAVPLAGMAERPSLIVARVQRLLEATVISLEPRRSWHLLALGMALLLTVVLVPGVRAAPAVGWFEGQAPAVATAAAAEGPAEADVVVNTTTTVSDESSAPKTLSKLMRRLTSSEQQRNARDAARMASDSAQIQADVARIESDAAAKYQSSMALSVATGTPGVLIAQLAAPAAAPAPAAPPAPPAPAPAAAPKAAKANWGFNYEYTKAWSKARIAMAKAKVSISGMRHGRRGQPVSSADPATVDALVKALKDPDAGVREAAAESLGRLADVRALDGLITAASDSDAKVRAAVVEALAVLQEARAIPVLARALKDSNVNVRREAAEALSSLNDAPESVEPLVSALGDSDVHVRLAAVQGLSARKDKRALAALAGLMKDSSPEVRAAAVCALGELQDASSLPALTTALKDENEEVRAQAVRALGNLETPKAIPALIEATKDRSSEVRSSAANALGELHDAANSPQVVTALKALLEDSSSEVREQAINALSEIRDSGALQALIAAMQSKDPVVRKAAAAALGQRD
jgi:HEAT repeat protein/Zn-dependent protease with chaperone function